MKITVVREVLSDGSEVFNLKLGDEIIHLLASTWVSAHRVAKRFQRLIEAISTDKVKIEVISNTEED